MRITLSGIEAAFADEEFALVCSLACVDEAGDEHYLVFQRTSEEAPADEDWGVHLEFDDQINGEYGVVRQCRLSGIQLCVDLSRQLGTLAGVDGFDVTLAIDDRSLEQLRKGLLRIHRDMPGILLAD